MLAKKFKHPPSKSATGIISLMLGFIFAGAFVLAYGPGKSAIERVAKPVQSLIQQPSRF